MAFLFALGSPAPLRQKNRRSKELRAAPPPLGAPVWVVRAADASAVCYAGPGVAVAIRCSSAGECAGAGAITSVTVAPL